MVMRPLIITALYPPAVGGAASYFRDITAQLIQHQEIEKLTILSEQMPGEPTQFKKGKLQLHRLLPNRISTKKRSWFFHAVSYVQTQLWFAVYLPHFVRKHEIDIIHYHTRHRGRLFHQALQRSHVPIVADLRDKMSNPQQLIGHVDRLLCCAEGVKNFAVSGGFPAEQINLIHIPLQKPILPSTKQIISILSQYNLENKSYLLFVGDITFNKGVYELLEAFGHWRKKHPQVSLVLVGINREGESFTKTVDGLEEVMYLGSVPHQTVMVLMHRAEIVILPSRSEGLPTVIIEAIAIGTKVIAPPNIPEFERLIPEFVLSEITVEAIIKQLHAVYYSDVIPTYQFEPHQINHVVDQLLVLWNHITGIKE
ncbi:MAG: hypothetical protein B6242_14215 [Anaerolineaceae bacterium 4572_78]|nr:MAG: hypothetical protein B6242_14215 [Anaerolineaceae bacterium 4572_78]